MKLTKQIPARTKTQYFRWCRKDFMKMSQQYRDIRAKMSSKLDSCYWCKYKFVDGEMMALAQPLKGLNRILCQNCANKLLGS